MRRASGDDPAAGTGQGSGRYRRRPAPPAPPPGWYWLGGRRTVAAALRAGRAERLALAAGARGVEALAAEAAQRGIAVAQLTAEALAAVVGPDARGCAALVRPLRPRGLDELLRPAPGAGRPPGGGARLLLACDRIQDPRNLGAMARTLEAVGGAGLILQRHRAVGITPVVERTAAGALESLEWAVVHNLPQALDRGRQAGYWIFGASLDGEPVGAGVDWAERSILVVGSEGRGIGPLVGRRCDRLVALPMRGRVESLNASVAVGILLYDWLRWDSARQPGRGGEH